MASKRELALILTVQRTLPGMADAFALIKRMTFLAQFRERFSSCYTTDECLGSQNKIGLVIRHLLLGDTEQLRRFFVTQSSDEQQLDAL